jgi:hypothetical protein
MLARDGLRVCMVDAAADAGADVRTQTTRQPDS